jgi:tetratricopeptide (TPR) repeat protein
MHRAHIVLSALLLAAVAPGAFSASSGPSSMPSSMPSVPEREMTPEEKAKVAYNAGVRAANKGDKQSANAAKATDEKKKAKAAKNAAEQYASARAKFEEAVQLAPSMPDAWNSLGYTRRKLGDYEGALQAYDRALTLKPSFAEAIEYRGEAYLGLQRLEDAKQAYLDLFAGDRKLAEKLLGSMRSWVEAQRASGADASTFEEFAKWVHERSQIAAQTASLTRDGADSSWQTD